MWYKRDLLSSWQNEATLPVRALIGLRQVGKSSFLLRHKEVDRGYVTLDDPSERMTAQQDPELFLTQHPLPLIIDECQLAPRLFSSIKKKIDELPEPLKHTSPIWLSGSNQILLDSKIRESLAGRVTFFNLHPLSMSELRTQQTDLDAKETLLHGGWPALWQHRTLSPTQYLTDYIRTAVEKDAIALGGIEKAERFSLVLRLLSGRIGSLLNYSEIARDAGVSVPTVTEWIDLLTRLGFIYRITPYFTNTSKRLIKAPKLYLCDVGLAIRLSGWSDIEPLLLSPQAGAIWENFIFTEIVRTRDHHRAHWEISFWRTKDGEEIDFIVQNGRLEKVAIEVKLGGGDPLRYQRPKEFSKIFGADVPIILVGLTTKHKEWRDNIFTVDPRDIQTLLLDRLG
jgi:uncharacterized protein